MRRYILLMPLIFVMIFGVASETFAAVPIQAKQKVKNSKLFSSKELGISFSHLSNLSFTSEKTEITLSVTSYEPSIAKYIRTNANKTLLSIYKKGYTQDRVGTVMVFNKPFADVLKGYKDINEKALSKKRYGNSTWYKYEEEWPEYYLKSKKKTYVIGASPELTENDLALILKTFKGK